MGIPPFDWRGVLPIGLHTCNPDEFIDKFCKGGSCGPPLYDESIRDGCGLVINELFESCKKMGAKSVIFGGSFVTAEPDPNDVDCIVVLPSSSIPRKNEMFSYSECKLDIVYVTEQDKQMVYNMINLLAKDRYETEVGIIEVLLDGVNQSAWENYKDNFDLTGVLNARLSYYARHTIQGARYRGLLVTIHGINTHARWNVDLAPIASANNWIFAPYCYGKVLSPLVFKKKQRYIMNDFRDWILDTYNKYQMPPSFFAHSFGSYIIANYVAGFNSSPPIPISDIVLAGSILSSEFDWTVGLEQGRINTVLNIESPNDLWVNRIKYLNYMLRNPKYGAAGVNGFLKTHPKLFSDRFDIFDHCNMLKVDIFERRVLPYLNYAKSLIKV